MIDKLRQGGLWRWASWGLLLMSLLTGSALCFSVWSSYQSIQRISKDIAHGEGHSLLNRLQRYLSQQRGPLKADELTRFLKESKSSGLVYIGLFRPRGRKLAEVGTPLGQTSFPVRTSDFLHPSTSWGKRLRMKTLAVLRRRRLPTSRRSRRERRRRRGVWRRRRWQGPLPEGAHRWRWQREWRRRNRRARIRRMLRRMRRTQVLIIEFAPQAALTAQKEAQRTLLAGGLAALALLLVTLFFWIVLHRLSRLETQRQEEQQLALLGEMSAVMAHEIRNPLTSLKGHAQLLQEALDEGSRQHKKAGRVVEEAVRLEVLTSQLLDFVRQGELALEDVSLRPWLQERIDALLEGSDRVDLDISQAPEQWRFDRTRITQVISNLLTNAIQASPPERRVDVVVKPERGQLQMQIRDRGAGLPPGQESEIFTPFFTTKTKGTGLGLAVARRLIDLHNGTITAGNHPQGGAVFTVTLPPQKRA